MFPCNGICCNFENDMASVEWQCIGCVCSAYGFNKLERLQQKARKGQEGYNIASKQKLVNKPGRTTR
jgi:hypothetical protein